MNNIEKLKQIWLSVYDSNADVQSVITKFFHKDYEQCINGVTMRLAEYINHVIMQKQNMTMDSIDYKHILEKEDELFAIYYPKGKNLAGFPIEAEVIAYFSFKNNQIFKIRGQVMLIKGSFSEVDMKN